MEINPNQKYKIVDKDLINGSFVLTGKELNIASHEVAEKTAQEWSNYPSDMGRAHLDQIRLILDKEEPDYQN